MWGEETFYSPMIRSLSLSEPVPLDSEFHKYFSETPPLGGTEWLEWSGIE